ncbi:MAG: GldM family protein [Ferruginibacter sp.]
MTKNIMIVLFIIFTQSLSGQSVNLINKTVSDKNCKTLYIGVENELLVTNDNSIGIEPQPGVSLEKNKLTVRPKSEGKLTIVFLTDKGKIPMDFDVRRIPDLIPIIAGQDNRQISKDVILAENLISLKTNDNNSFFAKYDIVSFTAKFKSKTFDIEGNKFSTEILKELDNAKAGDTITITSLVAHNNDVNKTINLNSNYAYNIK